MYVYIHVCVCVQTISNIYVFIIFSVAAVDGFREVLYQYLLANEGVKFLMKFGLPNY